MFGWHGGMDGIGAIVTAKRDPGNVIANAA